MNDINELTTLLDSCHGITSRDRGEFEEYCDALRCYWEGRVTDGIDQVSSVLMKSNQHAFEAALYRLWVELLIKDEDKASLRVLDRHLLVLSAESDDCQPYRGIRGIINLELDNWQACELIWLAVKEESHCNYCLEFLQYFYNRQTSAGSPLPASLLLNGQNITDYFHWDTISDALVWDGRFRDLLAMRKKQSAIYPDSPALDWTQSMIHVEKNEYAEARGFSEKLQKEFPANSQFSFLNGYINCKLEMHEQALKSFQAIQEDSLKDPDTTAYKAYCHHRLSKNDILSYHWEKALTLYDDARKGYEENGMPVTHVSYLKSLQTQHLKTKKSEGILDKHHKIRYWITPLSAVSQGELNTGDESDLEVIYRSIGKKPAPFDLVFMVSEDINRQDSWKLSALYYVAMDAVKHPLKRWESTLHLVKRFTTPISLDLILSNEEDRRSTPRPDDIKHYNMLEIDEAAFDTIRDLISEETRFLNEPVDFENLYAKSS